MNWAMPLAPLGLSARGLKPDSWRRCAAISGGVTSGHREPAQAIQVRYRSGTTPAFRALVADGARSPKYRAAKTPRTRQVTATIAVLATRPTTHPLGAARATYLVRSDTVSVRVVRG